MKRLKNYFDSYDGDGTDDEYKLNGGDVMNKWVDKALGNTRDTIDHQKRVRMDAGENNQYKDTHTKDRDNADPTRVRIPKIHKGLTSRNIMTNKVAYESVSGEIDIIRYLIEYMNNNDNKEII
jgi:hypothetical protein